MCCSCKGIVGRGIKLLDGVVQGMVGVRREPHLRQEAEPELYETVKGLVGSSVLVVAGWESEQVETYLERPGTQVADTLDDIVDGTYSGYWPRLDREQTQFWIGSEDTYTTDQRFQVKIPGVEDVEYNVYGDFLYADDAYRDELTDLLSTSGFSTARELAAQD